MITRWHGRSIELVGFAALLLAALHGCDSPCGVQVCEPGPSTDPPPATRSEPLFLTFNGREGTGAEAEAYIAANNQPPTLTEFKAGACLVDGASLQYFNFADLGLGRNLTFARCGTRIAACVENAGVPGQNAFDGLHSIDGGSKVAVCMDYLPSRKAPFKVQFYVYVDGKPATSLQFDRQGEKLSPFACTGCHGGRLATQDEDGQPFHQVENAFMLPLLKESLIFPKEPEEQTLRQMNALIYDVANDPGQRAPGILDLLDAAYPSSQPAEGVHQPGSAYVKNGVPKAWQSQAELYQELLLPHCLGCHAAQIEGFGFPMYTPSQFQGLEERTRQLACEEGVMPNSLEGGKRFRGDGTARHLVGCD